ncbi:MAG: sugar phosphate nucleotidyltransferase [Saprospiraceae bacterium]|nr:sugar phosphate nucleotidyltransferase [Saprospiraceae bacterium]MDW8230795.1 sugar phosphate nucleotidyltransferase [Saprospiraceae bacterium]
MKVVIPVAGAGARLRPHTYTQPKPLMPVAGKPIICFIIDKLAEAGLQDFVFVIGYLGEKVRDFIEKQYPHLNAEFVYQESREGSGHAVWTAHEAIEDEDEIFIAFGDTIFEADLRQMLDCPYSCLGVKKVDNPREFGVAELNAEEFVVRVVEKPRIPKTNMAIVGLYKVKNVSLLLRSVEHLMSAGIRTFGEIQLTDALQFMIEQGEPFKAIPVQNWFDCGRKEVLLETNAMLLNQRGYAADALDLPLFDNTIIIHPVAIGDNCRIANSIIGPNVTIGNGVSISNSIIRDSIIGNQALLEDVVLRHSVVGIGSSVRGLNLALNIGDDTEIDFR